MRRNLFAIALATLIGMAPVAGCAKRAAPTIVAPLDTRFARADEKSLNRFISILIDADALYRMCAEKSKNRDTRELILLVARKRNDQRRKLQEYIVKAGGSPDEYGEALGTGHRMFMEVRMLFEPSKKVAIEEVLRGEYYILKVGDKMGEAPAIQAAGVDDVIQDVRRDVPRLETMLQENGWPQFGPH